MPDAATRLAMGSSVNRPGGAGDSAAGRGASRRRTSVVVAACGLLLSATALCARERIDVVTLVNGDRLTGEIIEMKARSLAVRTKAVGTVEIDWPDVETMVSEQAFEIERLSGERQRGTFAAGAPAGELALRLFDGTLVEVPLTDVASIIQQGASGWPGYRGTLDLGFDYADANEELQLSLAARLSFVGPRMRWHNEGSITISDGAERERRDRRLAISQLELPVAKSWSWLGRAVYESNDDLDLDSRISAAAGGLWTARRSQRGRVGLGAGLVLSRERYSDAREESVDSGLLQLVVDFDRFGTFSTHLTSEIVYLPVLDGSSRFRMEGRVSLRQKLTRNLSFALKPYYSYDSRPPRADLLGQDWGLVSSLGWIF